MKIKQKFKEWFFKEELENQEIILEKLRKEYEMMKIDMKTILGVIELGIDVHEYRPDSWAVICINGNPDYIKFIDLSAMDLREIQKFLKHFEYSKKIIDARPQLKRFLNW